MTSGRISTLSTRSWSRVVSTEVACTSARFTVGGGGALICSSLTPHLLARAQVASRQWTWARAWFRRPHLSREGWRERSSILVGRRLVVAMRCTAILLLATLSAAFQVGPHAALKAPGCAIKMVSPADEQAAKAAWLARQEMPQWGPGAPSAARAAGPVLAPLTCSDSEATQRMEARPRP